MSSNFDNLEIKIAFLEEAIAQLSDEHFKQQRDLAELNKKYLDLKNKLENQSFSDDYSSGENNPLNEKPPHY